MQPKSTDSILEQLLELENELLSKVNTRYETESTVAIRFRIFALIAFFEHLFSNSNSSYVLMCQ